MGIKEKIEKTKKRLAKDKNEPLMGDFKKFDGGIAQLVRALA